MVTTFYGIKFLIAKLNISFFANTGIGVILKNFLNKLLVKSFRIYKVNLNVENDLMNVQ